MQIVFLYGKWPSSLLTLLATGSTCYHVGFTDGVSFWDMHKRRRRQSWPGLYPESRVILKECPAPVTAEYLNGQLVTDKSTYGWRDYLLFSVRWAYHLVGCSTRNYGGIICSEMVDEDMGAHGWPVKFEEVPSPADLELIVLGRKNAIRV